MTWKHLTLMGAGAALLVGLTVIGYMLGWPPFPDDAPETAQPAAVPEPPPPYKHGTASYHNG